MPIDLEKEIEEFKERIVQRYAIKYLQIDVLVITVEQIKIEDMEYLQQRFLRVLHEN